VYFENFPRVAWELRSEYDENQKKYRLGLFCRKSNIGHLRPLGLEMILSPEAFFFAKADVEAMRGKDTLATAILQVLEEKAMTTKQLAEELGAKTVTIRVTLSRLREQKKVERYGELWRLVREATPF
jgi:predicted Rossmann fold nucleotide-binding protein DprA/Smf involved in DNA uptake